MAPTSPELKWQGLRRQPQQQEATMTILGDIVGAILGTSPAHASEVQPAPGGSPAAPRPSSSSAGPAASTKQSGSATAAAAAPTPSGSGSSAAASNVDVAAILDKKAKAAGEKLDWRKSIVDLMKLLQLDSSAKARHALADELKYHGDKNDSAKMNVWLHKQVMAKLAANGGIVPKDLQD
jgi:hypothetical protein